METFESIKSQIDTAIASESTLSDLPSNGSATSIFKSWRNIVAGAIFTIVQIFEKDKQNLTELTERRRYGTLGWYASESLDFQLGVQLTFNSITGQFYYDTINESLQIIKKASVNEGSSGQLILRVAKEDNNDLAPLTPAELTAFISYIEDIKVAGTDIDVVSLPADTISFDAEVFYDGNLLVPDVQAMIQDALDEYQLNAPFNGIVLKNELIDRIRELDGIEDVHFTNLQGTSFGNPPTSITREYFTTSGYFVYSNTLMDNWTFTPIQ